jgi:hypothetical protein
MQTFGIIAFFSLAILNAIIFGPYGFSFTVIGLGSLILVCAGLFKVIKYIWDLEPTFIGFMLILLALTVMQFLGDESPYHFYPLISAFLVQPVFWFISDRRNLHRVEK